MEKIRQLVFQMNINSLYGLAIETITFVVSWTGVLKQLPEEDLKAIDKILRKAHPEGLGAYTDHSERIAKMIFKITKTINSKLN